MGFSRFHPHAGQHTFDFTDQLPPAVGTLRFYVDGTLGSDTNTGQGGWTNAWRTADKLLLALNAILFIEPNGLAIEAFCRGTVAAGDVFGRIDVSGTSRFYIGQHVDDFEVVRAGAVTAVGGEAGPPKHGMERLTVNVAGLDGTEVGCTLVLSDPLVPTNRATCTVLRVNVASGYLWTSQLIGEFPAWVAASPANVSIRRPSAYVTGGFVLQHSSVTSYVAPATCPYSTSAVLGLRSGGDMEITGPGITVVGCYARSAALAWKNLRLMGGHNVYSGYLRFAASYGIPDSVMQDFGFIGGPTPTPNNCVGNAANNIMSRAGGFATAWGCYTVQDMGIDGRGGEMTVSRSCVRTVQAVGQHGFVSSFNTMNRGEATNGAFYAYIQAWVDADKFSLVDIPATGLARIYRARRGSTIRQISTAVEGDNTGTGICKLATTENGGHIRLDTGLPDTIKAKTMQLEIDGDGTVVCGGAVTIGSREGLGPDIYIHEGGLLVLNDNFTKSAVNSETAIQSGIDGQIIVGAPDTFTAASAVFTAAHVGRSIKISVAVNAGNIGVHEITSYVNPTTVGINNIVAPVNEAGLTWGLVGTPRPILEVARGGRALQAAGKTFNVRKPEVEPAPGSTLQEWSKWGYGLAGEGWANIHEGAEVVLGTLVEAAGAANAAGIAARIKNESKLIHTGGAVILGTAPLDLGGSAAQAWPATIVSDAAAATPQGCRVIANVV